MPSRSYDFIARLVAKDKASRELSKVNKAAQGTEKAFGALGKAVGVFGVGLTAGAMANAAWDMAQLGAEVQALESSFQRLGTEAGIATGKLMNEMRQASRGAIADAELLKNANKALAAGGAALAEELPALLNIARGAAKATGEDFNYMLDSIVTGIARQSPMILDNLGLVVDLGDAYAAMASKLGKAASDLTKAEQITAVLQAVKDSEGAGVYADIAEEAGDLKDVTGQLITTWQNLRAELGQEIAVPLTGVLQSVQDVVDLMKQDDQSIKGFNDALARLGETGYDTERFVESLKQSLANLSSSGITGPLNLASQGALYRNYTVEIENTIQSIEDLRALQSRQRAGETELVDLSEMDPQEIERMIARLEGMQLPDKPIKLAPELIVGEQFYMQAGKYGGNAGAAASIAYAKEFKIEKAIEEAANDDRYMAPLERMMQQQGQMHGHAYRTSFIAAAAGEITGDTSIDQITDPMLKNLAKKLDEADLSLELSAVDAENYPQKLYDAVTSTQSNNWYELAGERIGERMGQSTMSQFTQIVIDNADGAAIEIYDAFEEAFMNALKGGSAAP